MTKEPHQNCIKEAFILAQYWHNNRYTDPGIESSEINLCLCSQYLAKEARARNEVKVVSSIDGVGKAGPVPAKK